MSNPNEALGAISQAVASTDFTQPGGQLQPKQQELFFQYLRNERNPLLSQVRFHGLTQITEDIDKMHIGEPITELAPEDNAAGFGAKPQFGQPVRMTAIKMRSSWEMTEEASWATIEKKKLQATIMDKMAVRSAVDFEILGVQGDTSISGTTPYELLKKANDGWDKLTDEAHLVDAAGAGPNYDLFADAWLRMPSHLQVDPGLKWIWNPACRVKLAQTLQSRNDIAGTNALQMVVDGPLGIKYIEASAIPRSKTVSSLAAASPAVVRSLRSGPFYLEQGVSDKIQIDVDNEGSGTGEILTFTGWKNGLTKGPVHTRELAKFINDALVAAYASSAYANFARDDGDGFLVLQSPTTGATSEIDIQAEANDMYTAVGLTVAVTNGAAALSGTSAFGSFIWLLNPENLMYAVLDRTRVFSRFLEERDKTRVIMYNWADFAVEELDAVVKIQNVVL